MEGISMLDERYLKILRRALAEEEKHANDEHYLGWEWYEVQAPPAMINKLVTEGLVRINYKSNSSTNYLLVDREKVKQLLEKVKEEEGEEECPVEIPDDLFDVIELHDDKKELVMSGLLAEDPVHFLLVGSPASAKSLFLMQLARLPCAILALGSETTKVGIVDLLFERRPRYLIIDELDKVSSQEDLAALLSLMEGGVVVETKHRRRREGKFDTRVFAGANRLDRIPAELRSRFLILTFREYTPDEFHRIAVAVLTKREGAPQDIAELIADRLLRDLGTRDVRDAVKVARLAKQRDGTWDRVRVNRIIDLIIQQGHRSSSNNIY
ncbi:MAG: AAA family ATPase [Nitrososphaeria archaeon]